MGKYEPLEQFLVRQSSAEVPMTFTQIEDVLGAQLPPVARKHRAWWSNNPSNNVITRAWLAAGRKTANVDMASETLVFRRIGGDVPEASLGDDDPGRARRRGFLERIRAELGGTVTIPPGADITEPTGEIWDAQR